MRGGLGFVSPRVSFGQETLGPSMLLALVEALAKVMPAVPVVHPNLAASRINQAGVSAPYGEMMRSYDQTGILEHDALAAISEAIGARFVAVPLLVNFREESSTRLSMFGLRIGKTAASSIRLRLQIWDGRSGRIVWDGLSELTLAEESVRERFVLLEPTMEMSSRQLLEQIPSTAVSAQ
jgi:hypothetical protein